MQKNRCIRTTGSDVQLRDDDVYLVPFIENDDAVFLKTSFRVGRPRSSTSVGRPTTMKNDADEKALLEFHRAR